MVRPLPSGHRDLRVLPLSRRDLGLQLLCLRDELCCRNSPCLLENQGGAGRLHPEAAGLAARQVKFNVQALSVQVSRILTWMDSLSALLWIVGEPFRWKTSVRNPVLTIQAMSGALHVEWRHYSGESNPADFASRGSSAPQLHDTMWRNGPIWITEHTAWPAEQNL